MKIGQKEIEAFLKRMEFVVVYRSDSHVHFFASVYRYSGESYKGDSSRSQLRALWMALEHLFMGRPYMAQAFATHIARKGWRE